MSWVDVTFASGRSALLLGERVVALVGAGPDAGTTIALMKVDDGENSLIADLGRLSDGRDDHALNEFVALVNHEDQVHLLIRGSFGASVRRSSGTLEVFSGIGLLGWTEVVLDSADVVELHDGSPGLSREPTQYRATLGIVPASTANVRILDRTATTVDPSSLDEENADNGEASDIDSGALPKTSQFGVEDREEASNGALEGALVEVEPGEVVGVADEIGEGGGGVLPADANSLDHGETLLEPGDFRSTASDESGSIDGLASIDVDVDQEEPAVERSGEYDDLFGATLIRSVEDAARRPDEEPSGEGNPGEPDDGLAEAAEPAEPADLAHDGHTIDLSSLRALRSGPDASSASNPGATLLSVECPEGHPNPPHATSCRVCEREVGEQTPVKIPQPVLATLVVEGLEPMAVHGRILVGRSPKPRGQIDASGPPRMLVVPSTSNDVSRTHLELRAEGWSLLVTDLGSANGTTVKSQGRATARLRPGESQLVDIGAVISLADEIDLRLVAP